MKVTVSRSKDPAHKDSYLAELVDDPVISGMGSTISRAIGAMVYSFPSVFGIELDIQKQDDNVVKEFIDLITTQRANNPEASRVADEMYRQTQQK